MADLPWLRDEVAQRVADEPSGCSFFTGHHERINNVLESARAVETATPGTYPSIFEGPHPKKSCFICDRVASNPFPFVGNPPALNPFEPGDGILDVGADGTFLRTTIRNVLDWENIWQQCAINEAGWRGGRRIGENDWVDTDPSGNLLHPIKTVGGSKVRAKFLPWTGPTVYAKDVVVIPDSDKVDALYGGFNELSDTENFDSATTDWVDSSGGLVHTPNSAVAPDGTLTADTLLQQDSTGDSIFQNMVLVASTVYNISVYMKDAGAVASRLIFFDSTSVATLGLLDILWTDGVPSTAGTSGVVNNIVYTNVGNGWFRVSFDSATLLNTASALFIAPEVAVTAQLGAFYWGVKVEALALSRYKPLSEITGPANGNGFYYKALTAGTTDAEQPPWPVGNNGDIIIDGSVTWELQGLYRIAGLRVEPDITNSALQSRDLDTTWTVTGVPTLTQDQVGIDGALNTAWTIEDDNAAGFEFIQQDITIPNDSDTHMFSVFVKKDQDETRFPGIVLTITGGTEVREQVSLNTRTGVLVPRVGFNDGTSIVKDIGDWWQVSCTLANNSTLNVTARVQILPAVEITQDGTWETATLGIAVFDQADFVLDVGLRQHPFTPIFTTTVPVARGFDNLSYPAAGNFTPAAWTAVLDAQMDDWPSETTALLHLYIGLVGTAGGSLVESQNGALNTFMTREGGGQKALDATNDPATGSSATRTSSRNSGTVHQIASETVIEADIGAEVAANDYDADTIHIGSSGSSGGAIRGAIDNVRIYTEDLGTDRIREFSYMDRSL